jgi:hypothetical protein
VLLIIALGILCVAFLAIFWLTPWGVPGLMRLSGGQLPPDLSFSYGTEEVYQILGSYGSKGILHWRRLLWLDMIFPGIYAAFLVAVSVKWAQAVQAGLLWQVAAAACPILAGLSDYFENMLWLRILCTLPKRSDAAVATAHLFTRAKFVFFGATVAIPLLYFVAGQLALA